MLTLNQLNKKDIHYIAYQFPAERQMWKPVNTGKSWKCDHCGHVFCKTRMTCNICGGQAKPIADMRRKRSGLKRSGAPDLRYAINRVQNKLIPSHGNIRRFKQVRSVALQNLDRRTMPNPEGLKY